MLISLTDDYNFGMFAVASAEPRPAMVVVMDKIGQDADEATRNRSSCAATPTAGRTGRKATTIGGFRPRARKWRTTCWCAAASTRPVRARRRIRGSESQGAGRSGSGAEPPHRDPVAETQAVRGVLTLAGAMIACVLGSMGVAHGQDGKGEPFELVRSLQSLQDQVVRGNTRAHAAQRVLLARTLPSGTQTPSSPRGAKIRRMRGQRWCSC